MDVKLQVQKGSTRTHTLRLRATQTTVGRQKGCGLRIPSNQVSRRHCVLTVQDGYVTVEDLESVNGTFLNGQRVSGRQVVRSGDRLEVGPVCFAVVYQPSPGAAPLPAADDGELDVLPLADDKLASAEAIELPVEEAALEALAVEALPAEEAPAAPAKPADDEVLEPIAVNDDEFETMAEGWKLPGSDDLRDLLSQMEEKKKPKR